MSLVKGFTDIIAPQNLATNGSFRINQRGLFTSLSDAKVEDYVSDAWQVWSSTTVDYLQCHNSRPPASSASFIRCKGYGKKNQLVYIYSSKPTEQNGLISSSISETLHTGTATFKGGIATVPLYCRVCGNAASGSSTIHFNFPTLRSGEVKRSVRIDKNIAVANTASVSNAIQVVLLADGEFDFYVYDFGYYIGGFVNPPQFNPISLADDLLRCKRYYQYGTVMNENQNIYMESTATPRIKHAVYFPIPMAGTPSITTKWGTLNPVSSAGTAAEDEANWSVSTTAVNDKGMGVLIQRTGATTYSQALLMYSWTATV